MQPIYSKNDAGQISSDAIVITHHSLPFSQWSSCCQTEPRGTDSHHITYDNSLLDTQVGIDTEVVHFASDNGEHNLKHARVR
jgi:hypothetical protein